MPRYQNFPFNSLLGKDGVKLWDSKTTWVYNRCIQWLLLMPSSLFYYKYKVSSEKDTLTRDAPNPCWFCTARGPLTELVKPVSCVNTKTHTSTRRDTSSLVTLWRMSRVLSQISGVAMKPLRNHCKKQSKLAVGNKHLIIHWKIKRKNCCYFMGMGPHGSGSTFL